MINKILIRTSDRKTLHKDRRSLGMNGENLQEVLLFCLDEKIEGNGIVEVELPNGTKGMIEVSRTEEGYELPIKSSLMAQTGFVKFQLRILHNDVEIFKSEIIALEVKESINATETIPEQYPTWIDSLETLKQDLEKAESERVTNEKERQAAEETRKENFTEMQKEVTSAVSSIEDLKEDYDENAKSKTEQFNSNYETKQKAINDNAEEKTNIFNTNVDNRTNTFNENSDNKLAEYNTNHTNKMKELNDNAADKESQYNTKAEQKETELEDLAEEKINEYNQNAESLTNRINELEAENKLIKEQIPSTSVSGNSLHIEDSGTIDFDWKVDGRHKQNGEPAPDDPVEIETVPNNINKFDGVLELGTIANNSGSNFASSKNTRSKNYIKVEENTTYAFSDNIKGSFVVHAYDKNKNWIKMIGSANNTGQYIFTTPQQTAYIRFRTNETDLTAKIKLEKGSTATAYTSPGMGSVEIDVVNKNLFDKNTMIELTNAYREYGNGGNVSQLGGFNGLKIPVKSGHRYILSTNATLCNNLCFFDKNMTFLGRIFI